jgi:hypothetical protein
MKLRSIILILVIASGYATNLAFAAAATESMGNCMSDAMSGKERKQMVQWVFMTIAAHPDMKRFSNMTEQDQIDTDKTMAALFTRLVTVDCVEQVKQATKQDGPQAFRGAFEIIGRLAMQDLMANKDVTASMTSFQKYLDKDKFREALGTK